MLERVGNCSKIIDWNEVIKEIAEQQPAYIGPSHKEDDPIPGLKEVTDLWKRSGFKTVAAGGTVGWDMFLPHTNFNISIAEKFCEFVGLKKYTSCWISRIHPAHCSPWHWDVHDDEVNLSQRTDIVRYHCHIGQPAHGHVLIVDDFCLYKQPQGEVYKWPSRTTWHCGLNSGLTPKYLFNIW